ncbi:hypothetical protein BX659_106175 [Orenia metallireducens]|uniref:hypothetical protein n=1 Tax=Orenia metallireducens TaxID=1413210 RepID=UPI000D05DFE1|nr:hypothetical protein [Orenia metallireducens]PRX31139.1 hypothetical protein BX659_106175 [Orenia metallireducens]
MLKKSLNLEEGSSLAIVVIIMGIVGMFTMVMSSIIISHIKTTHLYKDQKAAYYIARSAAASMVDWIKDNPSKEIKERFGEDSKSTDWTDFDSENKSAGQYKVSVKLISNDDEEGLLITSTGKVGKFEKTIKVKMYLGEGAGNNDTVNLVGIDKVVLSNSNVEGDIVLIGGNEQDAKAPNLNLYNGTTINGEIKVGVNTTADNIEAIKNKFRVKPTKLERIRSYTMPDFPDFPNIRDENKNRELNIGNKDTKTINENGYYKNITINNNGTLKIKADKVRIGRLEMKNGSNIEIGNQVLTEIYIDEEINLKSDAIINKFNKWKNLIIYCKGSTEFKANNSTNNPKGSIIYGSFYSETAPLNLKGTANIIGHIISKKNVIINGNFNTDKSKIVARVIYAPNSKVTLTAKKNEVKYNWGHKEEQKNIFTGAIIANDINISNYKIKLMAKSINSFYDDFDRNFYYSKAYWGSTMMGDN